MKMRSIFFALAAALMLWPAGAVLAQDLPDVPGIGAAEDQIARSPRVPRSPTSDLPASGLLPREVGAARATGGGAPTRLPETGVDTTALALDAVTLLGAGALLLTIRRRFGAQS